MKRISFLPSFLVLTLFLVGSCQTSKKNTGSSAASTSGTNTTADPYAELKPETGTMQASQLDGCHWILHLDSGKDLEPQGVPEKFLVDQMRVRVKYVPVKKGVSICMAGELATIVFIEKAD